MKNNLPSPEEIARTRAKAAGRPDAWLEFLPSTEETQRLRMDHEEQEDPAEEAPRPYPLPAGGPLPKPPAGQSKFQGYRTYTVGGYLYLMAYFEARFSGTGTVHAVAEQFTAFVAKHASNGFEFFRTDEVPFRITPGCIAGLLGAKESYGHCTIVTFRKKAE